MLPDARRCSHRLREAFVSLHTKRDLAPAKVCGKSYETMTPANGRLNCLRRRHARPRHLAGAPARRMNGSACSRFVGEADCKSYISSLRCPGRSLHTGVAIAVLGGAHSLWAVGAALQN